jgi:hypothetical protein
MQDKASLIVGKELKQDIKLHVTKKGTKMCTWVEQTLSNQLKKEQHGKDTK